LCILPGLKKQKFRFFSDYSSLIQGGGGYFSLDSMKYSHFGFSHEELAFISHDLLVPSSSRGELYVMCNLIRTFGEELFNSELIIYTDNKPSVMAVQKGWSDSQQMDSLVKLFASLTIRYNLQVRIQHISRGLNVADFLAKGDIRGFLKCVRETFKTPTSFAEVWPTRRVSPEAIFWQVGPPFC
jgi:hypothetical protein